MIAPVRLLLLQPTKFCNLDCSYCYLPNRHVSDRMSKDVLESVCTKLLRSPYIGSEIRVCLHGGEPLAVGVSWFRECLDLFEQLAPSHLHIKWAVQTNATLLTEEWVSVIEEYDVDVGVSLDGPRELHNQARINRSGRGSFDSAFSGLGNLRRVGISLLECCVFCTHHR
jgi:uncharacterized protein